jgi:hypothetical protein
MEKGRTLLKYERSDALISCCGEYRWWLSRTWSSLPSLCWIMLNPSTADAMKDDPTIRKCVRFAIRWGYGGIRIVNLFAFRATDPKQLPMAYSPIGKENDEFILLNAKLCRTVVCGWGVHGNLFGRANVVKIMLAANGIETFCLGTTKLGEPKHPLYLAGLTRLIPFNASQEKTTASPIPAG